MTQYFWWESPIENQWILYKIENQTTMFVFWPFNTYKKGGSWCQCDGHDPGVTLEELSFEEAVERVKSHPPALKALLEDI